MHNNTEHDLVINNQAELSFIVTSPTRFVGLAHQHYSPQKHINLSEFLLQLSDSGILNSLQILIQRKNIEFCPEIPLEHINLFRSLNILVHPEEIAQKPKFEPVLSDNLELIPHYLLPIEPVKINSNIVFQWTEEPPDSIRSQLPFWPLLSPRRPIIWVQRPYQNAWFPYWCDSDTLQILQELNTYPIELLPHQLYKSFFQADILWSPNLASERQFDQMQHDFLHKHNYIVLRDLIPTFQIGALREYLRALHKEGYFQRGDALMQDRDIIHNDPVMRFFHSQILNTIQKFFQYKLKLTYTYLSVYKANTQMQKHRDRDQCLWNMSLVLDMEHEVSLSDVWPICFETAQGEVSVKLNIGDAVIYPGKSMPHWRPLSSQSVSVALFHFVDQDFQGASG